MRTTDLQLNRQLTAAGLAGPSSLRPRPRPGPSASPASPQVIVRQRLAGERDTRDAVGPARDAACDTLRRFENGDRVDTAGGRPSDLRETHGWNERSTTPHRPKGDFVDTH